ncbi:MAG: glycosyltransferase family 4 protein [Candidatus Helarchaeota archaeon]
MPNLLICGDNIDCEGGAAVQRLIYQTAKHAKMNGYHPMIIGRRNHLHRKMKLRINQFETHRYYMLPKNSFFYDLYPIFTIIGSFYCLLKVLLRRRIDVIIHHNPLSAILSYLLLGNLVPQIFIFHSPRAAEFRITHRDKGKIFLKLFYKVNYSIEKTIYSRAKVIIAHSKYMASQLYKNFGNISGKLFIISPGVEIDKFCPSDKRKIRKRLNLPLNKKILLTVRRLEPRMGLENLIEAMEKVSQHIRNVLLLIIGKGRLHTKCKNLIEKKNLEDNVYLIGYVEDKLLIRYYQCADVFILPTKYYEGFGYVILEAFSTNLPVLGTSVGAISEILNRFNSKLIINGSSSQSIAEKTIIALKEPNLLNLKIAYRNTVIRQYTWSIFFDNFIDVVEKTILDFKIKK